MRRAFFILPLSLAWAALHAGPVAAQSYPSRAVRLIVPYGTGGGSDVLARQIAAGLQQGWGQAVTVENKAGASGNIGTQEVVRAPADGYTLLLQNSTMVTNLGVQGKLPYQPQTDLTPILLLGVTPMALVAHPTARITDVASLREAAKARPDLSYASCGIGTPQHFAMELVRQKTGTSATHAGYRGCAPALTDVVGGQIPLAMLSANLAVPYVKAGRLKVAGVTTAQRYALLPDTLTLEEQGLKPFDFSIWYALMGPARLPPTVLARIVTNVTRVLGNPAVRANLSNAGVEVQIGDSDTLSRLIRDDSARYIELARSANIKAE